MKKLSIKRGVAFLTMGLLAGLLALSCYYFQQKKVYEKHNRELIIQNDSIMSVNIELNKLLQIKTGGLQKATLYNYKVREINE